MERTTKGTRGRREPPKAHREPRPTSMEGHVCSGFPGESPVGDYGALKYGHYRENAEIIVHHSSTLNGTFHIPFIQRVSISRSLREEISRHYPITVSHDGHRAFLGYLLFTTFRGKDNRPVLKAEVVARIYDALQSYEARYVRVKDLLEIFRRDVLPRFTWTGFMPGRGCREAYQIGIDENLLLRIEEELRTRPDLIEDPVHWQTGRQIDRKLQTNLRKGELKAVKQDFLAPCEMTLRWQRYLNSRSSRLFFEIRDQFNEAWKVATDYRSKQKREGALRHLHRIHIQPKPIYRPSENSVRVVSTETLQTVDSEIRRILTRDAWREYDLTSSQLAIAAVEWDVPEVRDFLADGGSVWEHMARHTGLGIEYKPVFKKAVYTTAYGAGEANIRTTHMQEAADKEGLTYCPHTEGEAILSHPFLDALIPARNKQMQQIEIDGGAYDVFGNWLSVRHLTIKKGSCQSAVRSVLAQLNQAIEMDLLTPVLTLAEEEETKKRHKWQIALYQYDGFSVKYHRSEDFYHRMIVDTVNSRAKGLGYPTRLDVK